MNPLSPKKLLLAGAGHAHIGLLRRLSDGHLKNDNIDIGLISEQPQALYSGMLPGWMAGHYQLNDISIDIKSLCRQAGVRFIQQSITQVSASANMVRITGKDSLSLGYDVLSLNTGADTDMGWLDEPNGYAKRDARTRAIAIRPLSAFITHWQQILVDARQSSQYRLAIVGAGAAATELVMAAQVALQHINKSHQVSLVCGEHLLSGFNTRFQQRVIKQLHRL